MRIDRLFHVLVIGGAALGCSGEAPTKTPPTNNPEKDAASSSHDATTEASTTNDASAEASVDAARDVEQDGCALDCQGLGFPCCWMGDCTQEPMCAEKLCK